MAAESNVPRSPTLNAPFTGVPIIRVCVYQRANSQPGPLQLIKLPDPLKDTPQYQFGFKQTVKGVDHQPAGGMAYAKGVVEGPRVVGRPLPKRLQLGPSDEFEVVSARVNQTRFWSCSSATFTIAAPIDRWEVPKLPPVRPEDVITIELGYAPSLRVGLNNPNVWLCPVFYGIVDAVKERGGNGDRDGITYTISCRDPLRYLVDNKIRGTYLRPPGTDRSNRGYAVMDLLWMGSMVDHVKWETTAGKPSEQLDGFGNIPAPGADFTYEVDKDHQGHMRAKGGKGYQIDSFGLRKPKRDDRGLIEPAEYGPKNSYLDIGVIEESMRADIPFLDGDSSIGPQGIAIMDRFPLDLIKHFSLVETSPRELFADPATGKVHWMFRRTDMRRLKGVKGVQEQARRQFFYRFPENRANIIQYTNEWTTVGTVSHFTISNGRSHGEGTGGVVERYAESPMAMLFDPHRKKGTFDPMLQRGVDEADGIYLRQFTRQRFVYDDTLAEGEQLSVLANALFAIWGKDIQTGMVHVIGDPTLEIGEAIQLFNTGLFGRRLHPKRGTKPGSGLIEWVEDPLSPAGVYRVEGLQHLYGTGGTGKGYTTVIIFNTIDPPSKQIRSDADIEHPEYGIKPLEIKE